MLGVQLLLHECGLYMCLNVYVSIIRGACTTLHSIYEAAVLLLAICEVANYVGYQYTWFGVSPYCCAYVMRSVTALV